MTDSERQRVHRVLEKLAAGELPTADELAEARRLMPPTDPYGLVRYGRGRLGITGLLPSLTLRNAAEIAEARHAIAVASWLAPLERAQRSLR